ETLLRESQGERFTAIQDYVSSLQQRGVDGADIDKKLEETPDLAAAEKAYDDWFATYYWYNKIAAYMVSSWVTLLFLLVLRFGYSFFCTASTMIPLRAG